MNLQTTQVRLNLFDIQGKKLRTLLQETKEAGNHTFRYDAKDLASGIYYYQLLTKDISQTRIFLLMK